MTITQQLMAPGSFDLRLDPSVPRRILDRIALLDHMLITAARVWPETAMQDPFGDELPIYVGPVVSQPDPYTLRGQDISRWLGTADGIGPVIESSTSYGSAVGLDVAIGALYSALGNPLNDGTVTGTGTNVTGEAQWMTLREAIDLACSLAGAEWVINHAKGCLDAGLPASLFVTTPTSVVTRKPAGRDAALYGVNATSIAVAGDAEQLTIRAVVVAQVDTGALATGDADSGVTTYKNLRGDTAVLTRLINSPETETANADTIAALQLGRWDDIRRSVALTSRSYALPRDVRVGDYVWVWDQDAGVVDTANQVWFRGELIAPLKMRLHGITWPVEQGMGVYIRNADGTVFDISDWVKWETGDTRWEVSTQPVASWSLIPDRTGAGGAASGASLGPNPDIVARQAAL